MTLLREKLTHTRHLAIKSIEENLLVDKRSIARRITEATISRDQEECFLKEKTSLPTRSPKS